MNRHKLDPSPRTYAPSVFLQARSRRGSDCAPEHQTVEEVADWLLHEATRIDDVMLMFEEFLWRCLKAGINVHRASLHIGTLHPRVIGFSWLWSSQDGLCDEIAASSDALSHATFTRNPLYRVITHGETVVVDLESPDGANSTPLMRELADEGYTAYVAMPLTASGNRSNAITFATRTPGGFSGARTDKSRLINLLALHVERHIVRRIARNVVDTYLGPMAGRRVLDGEIKRGDGEAIDAVVFMSDLRGFTSLADRLTGPQVTALLNAYFDAVSNAVIDAGGDILKFIGDGILAVFDRKTFRENEAAEAALAAAQAALAAIERINEVPPADAPSNGLWHPLRIGIGLHMGKVFFGNVGGEDRLDFTVIGRAVNETSRVEALCKPLERTLLLTEPVRAALTEGSRKRLMEMGEHALRGVGAPVAIYAA